MSVARQCVHREFSVEIGPTVLGSLHTHESDDFGIPACGDRHQRLMGEGGDQFQLVREQLFHAVSVS